MNTHIFGREIIDDKTVEQFTNCMLGDSIGVLTADAHYGYSMPVGAAMAYKDKISPTGVGFDIGCGNYAVQTDIEAKNVDVSRVMDEIMKRVSFGMGRSGQKKMESWILPLISNASFIPQRALLQLAKDQLGTVGGGNHFVDLFQDEKGFVWIGLHFGSRGFGHKTASGFFALAQNKKFDERATQGAMDSRPILFDTNSAIGIDYIQAMTLAGAYAEAGRMAVMDIVLDILDNPTRVKEIHNHHNFAWEEEHFGEKYWVVRKGCTPAWPGQAGFIGANMKDDSYIVEGTTEDCNEAKLGLFSTVHGAGRVMSRTQAAGKKKWIRGADGVKRATIIAPGAIDFDKVKETMKHRNIELRGGGADEAPLAYKKLSDVLKYQGPTINILHTLSPIGVAMAGDEYDEYKD